MSVPVISTAMETLPCLIIGGPDPLSALCRLNMLAREAGAARSLPPLKTLLRPCHRVGGGRCGAGPVWRRRRGGGGGAYRRCLLDDVVRLAGAVVAADMLRLGCTCRGGALLRAGGVSCRAGGRRRLSLRGSDESNSGENGKSDCFHLGLPVGGAPNLRPSPKAALYSPSNLCRRRLTYHSRAHETDRRPGDSYRRSGR